MRPLISICRLMLRVVALELILAGGPRGTLAGVVINEVMYHPPNDRDTLQFIELFNAGESETDLSGWSFSRGIKFAFAPGTKLAPGAFVVVCRRRADFAERYGAGVPVVGDFEGKLSHGGERLELIDAQKRIVDAVAYSDQSPWPMAADGGSASLERICPQADSGASNWAPSRLPGAVRSAGSPGRTNDCFLTNLPPVFTEVVLGPERPAPDRPVTVRATVADSDGVKSVLLLYRVATAGKLSEESALPMQRVSGDERNGRFEAAIPAQPASRLVRYRLRAVDGAGTERDFPSTNDLRPALSYSTFVNTNNARVPFGFVLHPVGEEPRLSGRESVRFGRMNLTPVRGYDAFIYLPPDGGAVQTFDHVRVSRRNGGFKVRFHKDQTLRDMATVNVIFEDEPRRVLSEPLAYELYRLAGVPAEFTEHIRVWVDDRLLGYHLLVEQPNKAFLRRHGRDDTGNLYKLIWYGRDLVGKHEKKTNLATGHDDLLAVLHGLGEKSGAAQWDFIERHFNVTNFINYFAVNMCIQNWDGFFNNYFTYHHPGGAGQWEIYPWDEDKTWGDYDGASSRYDWYTMPLSYGMNGDSTETRNWRGFFRGSEEWRRPPGYFSGPLLANAEFRKRFLARLREICETVFTEAKMFPIIDTLEKRLTPEIPVRARATAEDTKRAEVEFRADIESFRRQVTNRRRFILSELDQAR
jgi:spore coat protein H